MFSGGADEDVHKEILRILDKALDTAKKQPRVHDLRYAEVNGDNDASKNEDSNEEDLKGVKCAKSVPPRSLDVIPKHMMRPCML